MLENLCGTCSECCHDMEIALTRDEASCLIETGTTLKPILNAPERGERSWNSRAGRLVVKEQIKLAAKDRRTADFTMFNLVLNATYSLDDDQGLYSMKGICGNLSADGDCMGYVGRPKVCKAFPLGGIVCVELRTRRLKNQSS